MSGGSGTQGRPEPPRSVQSIPMAANAALWEKQTIAAQRGARGAASEARPSCQPDCSLREKREHPNGMEGSEVLLQQT